MPELHSLLKRQLKQHFGGVEKVSAEIVSFVDAVNKAYLEFDDDRLMLERAMELSSTELLQANTDIQGVLEGLLDMLFRIDAGGQIIDCRIRNADEIPVAGETLAGKQIHDIPVEGLARQFGDAFRKVKESGELTSFVYADAGEKGPRFFEARLLPLKSGEFFLLVRNISEAKDAEIRERNLQMKLARSERMESLGILAGGVAHDLNNLLGPLVAYPDIILTELGPDTPVRADLEQIQNSAIRAAAMIQDLLTLARRGARKRVNLDMNAVVKNSLSTGELLDLAKKFPGVQIDVHLPSEPMPISASSHHLTQSVCNLIRNAYEAIPDKGRVVITVKQCQLDAPVGQYEKFTPGMYTVLSVEDNGEGINPNDVEHIFEPFYTKKKMGRSGSGLGLSVVYGVLQDNNGLIDIHTELGKGSRFDLYLPVALELEEEVAPPPLDYSGSEHVLVIEDEPDQRHLAERILSRLGYQVDVAENGRKAVEYLKHHTVDLILLDMIMEDDFDGLRTYQKILKLHPHQRCIIVSGFAENEKVRATQNLGAGMFVRKPYSIETIGRAVRAELDRRSTVLPQ